MPTSARRISEIPAMPRLPAVIATLIPGSTVSLMSNFAYSARSASSTSPMRGLGNSCRILTILGNCILIASFPTQTLQLREELRDLAVHQLRLRVMDEMSRPLRSLERVVWEIVAETTRPFDLE